MTLTVKEKEHWKVRITRKIEQAIEAVLAAENPNFMEQIKREAKDRAVKSLGIADLKMELDAIKAKKDSLDKKNKTALKRMLAVIRGVDMGDISDSSLGYNHSEPHEVTSSIHRRQLLIEKELLAENELGRRILRLQMEKEELLDTVWLATSPKQIKELWTTVNAALNQEPTGLQKEALNIEPMDSIKE